MTDNKIDEWKNKVQQNFNSPEALLQNVVFTLHNFVYRYLTTELTPQPEIKFTNNNRLSVISLEKNISGLSDTNLKNELINNGAKPFQLSLVLDLIELTPNRGEIILTSTVNWNGPLFEIETMKKKSIVLKFTYNELAEFRKNFALKLEHVCELFV